MSNTVVLDGVDSSARDEQLVEDDDLPYLTFTLEEDTDRQTQLQAPISQPYRQNEQQLLQEGRLGSAEFSARVRKVQFGVFDGQAACLVVLMVNFCHKNYGLFRFRSATVEVKFTSTEDGGAKVGQSASTPMIYKFDPELLRGHVASLEEKYGFKAQASPPSPFDVVSVGAERMVTRPREGQQLINGRLMGSPPSAVRWNLYENRVNKGGIYEQPKFAVIVQAKEKFNMSVGIKATTLGGLSVVGKCGSAITFTPSAGPETAEINVHDVTQNIVVGGSVGIQNQNWVSKSSTLNPQIDLTKQDLESLTNMRKELLGPQASGVSQNKFLFS